MILLIDDMRSFADGRVCVVARSSRAAIRWLEENPDQVLDELWLDCELGGFDNGLNVARYFTVTKRPIERLIMHSTHPEAEHIVRELEAAGYRVERYHESFLQDRVFAWIPSHMDEFDRGACADE